MVDLLSEISSYDLFNYLLTGIIFVILADKFTQYSFIQPDIALGLFLYYFVGLIVSRIGSLIIEPFLKSISFIEFESYKNFLDASEKDNKIELLSEVNNTYRTFCSLFIILIFLKFFEWIQIRFEIPGEYSLIVLIVLLFVIFLLSYRKQTNYITARIRNKN